MGDDNGDGTLGYMQSGDIPTFKIYDASENSYYDAFPTEEMAWSNNGFHTIDGLSNGTIGCTNTEACNYDLNATIDDGSCLENDCAGVCGGEAVVDCSGVCGGYSLLLGCDIVCN